jgi:hypothetical protein
MYIASWTGFWLERLEFHKEWRREPSVVQTLTSSALASSQDDCFAVFSYQKRYQNVIGNARPVGVGISQSPCKQDALGGTDH